MKLNATSRDIAMIMIRLRRNGAEPKPSVRGGQRPWSKRLHFNLFYDTQGKVARASVRCSAPKYRWRVGAYMGRDVQHYCNKYCNRSCYFNGYCRVVWLVCNKKLLRHKMQ